MPLPFGFNHMTALSLPVGMFKLVHGTFHHTLAGEEKFHSIHAGPFSSRPCSAAVHDRSDPQAALKASAAHIEAAV